MFNKILIANRGEIACRIMRTAKRLGIQTIAIYSEADAQALHVKLADQAYLIGPAPSQKSYLNSIAIIKTALAAGAQAIHPGYGFLSENTDFAQACVDAGIVFVGPSPNAIRAMGEKNTAKTIMAKAGVPIIPGYDGESQTLTQLQQEADKIGYPVIIKAVAGGGGKGMRVVYQKENFAAALAAAQREAKASFNNDAVILEKYLANSRHIEVQIFADNYGDVVHLFERDCSIQRRHQKIIEEAPAPNIDEKLRKILGNTAITAAQAINYRSAGTVEFLLNENNQFYFMEMNTRLQVEHPVTELITGIDLVEWQLRIAAGEHLPLQQNQITHQGHAFEVRICAEDPSKDFLPATGCLLHYQMPTASKHIRIDSGVTQNDNVNVYYDSLLTKLIVWDKDRKHAIQRLQAALFDTQIIGVANNLALLTNIITNPDFIAGKFNTNFIVQHQDQLNNKKNIDNDTLATCILALLLAQLKENEQFKNTSNDIHSPWFIYDNWQMNLNAPQKLQFWLADKVFVLDITYENNSYHFKLNNKNYAATGHLHNQHIIGTINQQAITATVLKTTNILHVFTHGQYQQLQLTDTKNANLREHENAAHLTSPMPGTVINVNVQSGQKVNKGDSLMIIEAMKMEHTLYAPSNGVVKDIFFKVGDLINEGVELLALELH